MGCVLSGVHLDMSKFMVSRVCLGLSIIFLFALSGCGGGRSSGSEDRVYSHTVKPGESISDIADDYYGDPDRADKLFAELAEIDPKRERVMRIHVVAYRENGEAALALVDQELTRTPGDPELLMTRGDLLEKADRTAEADADYQAATEAEEPAEDLVL